MNKTIKAGAFEFTLKSEEEVDASVEFVGEHGGLSFYRFSCKWNAPTLPKPVSIAYAMPSREMFSVFHVSSQSRAMDVGYWTPTRIPSRLAQWMPIVGIVSKDGFNRHLVAVSDVKTPLTVGYGASHRTLNEEFEINFFTATISPIKEYEALIRMDERAVPFSDAVKSAREWYDEFGYELKYCPDDAKKPMYSTWYSYFQDVTAKDTLRECRLAKKYGMETVIVDDGWQMLKPTGDYSFTGDWTPCKRRFFDMKNFVDKVHAIGMKAMLWYSVPFMGYNAKLFKRFESMALRPNDNIKALTLDPRYLEVRKYLIETYCKALTEWGFDGLKLDFIDRFYANGEIKDGMDFDSVEDATEKLMRDVYAALTAINPDVLIEFRQPYMGPVISGNCNMMRVWDCPINPYMNFTEIASLRLTSGKCAVHADMIDWNAMESVEGVGVHLISSLFAVPQISVRLNELAAPHAAVLKAYLAFWNEHRKLIMDGNFSVRGNEQRYGSAQSTLDGEKIVVSISSPVFEMGDSARGYFFNLTDKTGIIVKGAKGKNVEVFDAMGGRVSRKVKIKSDLAEVYAPLAGRVQIEE